MVYSNQDRSVDFDDLRLARTGDKEAFKRLVERYRDWAFGVALGYLGDEMTAYDISQRAFIKVWRKLGEWNELQGFRAWFYTIIKNLCLNHRRKSARLGEEKITPNLRVKIASPEEDMLSSEAKRIVWRALDKLQPEHREIVVLVDIRGMKYRQVAELLDIPVGTVMSRLYYARKKLAEILKPYWEREL
ncbi:RNA polymerase sigma factor [bacterium]|nr:RNA polymerase sigma factor [bacterium]